MAIVVFEFDDGRNLSFDLESEMRDDNTAVRLAKLFYQMTGGGIVGQDRLGYTVKSRTESPSGGVITLKLARSKASGKRESAGELIRVDPSNEVRPCAVFFDGKKYARERNCCELVLSGGETFMLPGGAADPVRRQLVGRLINVIQFDDGETRIDTLD